MKLAICQLSILTCLLISLTSSAQEIQFIEKYAIASDRDSVLEELIPGTEEYYYFYAMHYQNQLQLEEVDKLLKPWIKRFGNSARVKEVQNRQALLRYDDNPQATLDYLKRELGVQFNHQRKVPQADQRLPKKLDSKLIDPELLVKAALARSGNTDQLESAALPLIANEKLNHGKLNHLLGRVVWPNFPNLVPLVAQELNHPNSRGFGRLSIHNRLTLDQLKELQGLSPKLKNHANFVNAYLSKLRPSNDIDWTHDLEEQRDYLNRLWAYVETLDPVHNSLKACVRFHQLRVDQRMGKYDREKFLSYLQLPRRVFYVSEDFIKRSRNSRYEVNMNADYRNQIRLLPINNDEPLVRDYLHQFLKRKADLDDYSRFIDTDYLKTQLATTNILQGLGDVEKWASMLAPEAYKALIERSDLDFAATNQSVFQPNDLVKLNLFTKNVDKLIVKIFEVNSENYYRRFGREIDTDINLDGLVPNDQKTFEYSDAPAIRKERTFEFPDLKDRGVYVIDFIGNGKSSRAIIRKGQLTMISQVTLAGHEFTVMDEAGQPLTDATLWIAGKTYEPVKDKDGKATDKIIVPFSTQPGRQSVIIRQGDFSSLEFFQHKRENYSLSAGIFIDRESLIRNRKSQVVIRPHLQLSGSPIPPGLLENVRVDITTKDLDGNSSTTTRNDLELSAMGETIVTFQVPPRLQSVSVSLSGKIESMSLRTEQTINAGSTIGVNQIDRGQQIQDVHLLQSQSEHKLSVRGKSGEPRPRQAVLVKLKSKYIKQPIVVSLQSDNNGLVELGSLGGIDWISANCTGGQEHRWFLERNHETNYSSIHSVVGKPIRIAAPVMLQDANPLQVALFEVRGNSIVKDWFSSIVVVDGLVGLKDLAAGDYQLVFKDTNQVFQIRVAEGDVVNTTIVGKHRRLETRRETPLHIRSITSDEGLKIQLGGVHKSTRVHVFATHFVPRFDAYQQFQVVRDTEPLLIRPGARRSSFMAGRKIGDEYQYILDRRYTKKFVGNMLERPSVLLNPFAIDSADNQQEDLERGAAFNSADDQAGSSGERSRARKQQAGQSNDFANLDFLSDGTVVLANLEPDENGTIVVAPEKLAGKQHLVVVAADLFSTVQRTVATKAISPKTRDLRLANAFDPDLNVSQSKQTELLDAGKEFLIENILTARFQSFDDLGDIFSVLKALNPDPNLTTFEFILTWPDKTLEEKQTLYSEHSCHELNFFIANKDPEFFNRVVKPYIANKREKTFIDHYLLKENLLDYLTPWRFAKLNSVERILLSQRMEERQQDLIQHLNELYRLNPTSRVYAGQLYDSTIAAGFALAGGNESLQLRTETLKENKKSELPRMSAGRGGGMELGYERVANSPEPEMGASFGIEGVPQDRGRRALGQSKPGKDPSVDVFAMEIGGESDKRLKDELESARKSIQVASEDETRFADLDRKGWNRNGDSGIVGGRELRIRSQSLYRRIAQTKEWIEQHYYRLLPVQHNAERVTMNRFWQDFANHESATPFISSNFAEAHRNFTEMMFVVSVLDIPFKAAEHKTEYVENQMKLTPGSPMIALHQQLKPSVVERRNTTVLVSENFFQMNDRYRFENNQRFDKFINDKFSAHTLYGGQVVITNPTSSPRNIELLVQIPQGAVVASSTQETKTTDMSLAPFSTQSLEYAFYFPTAGDFTHFPAHVASEGKVVAVADQVAFRVVDEPVQQDKSSWEFVSQNGSNDEVIDFINRENVLRLDLSKIAFRMKNKSFFTETIKALRNRYAFDATLWSYALLHNEIDAVNEYLDQANSLLAKCGPYLKSTPLTIEPVLRNWYEHREYSPLVNARVHQVGKNRKILNQKFHSQYHKFMAILARTSQLDVEDRMAMTYYLLLQDRIEEAIEQFEMVNRDEVAEKVQYDYCKAYVAMYLERPDEAAEVATAYTSYPVDKWQKRFATVLRQVEEIRSGKVAAADPKNQTEQQTELASKAPSFDFEVEGGHVTLNYQNLDEVVVNYYQMDIELLFSRKPFNQTGSQGFSLIRPNQSHPVKLDGSGKQLFHLPDSMQNKNVTIEITGKDQSESKAYYAHQLSVQLIENFGQLKLTSKDDSRAIAKAYVKVYARNADGSVKFFKDGYTDLRGRFDYATQSNYPLDGVQQFSILIMSEEHGTTVRKASPPKE